MSRTNERRGERVNSTFTESHGKHVFFRQLYISCRMRLLHDNHDSIYVDNKEMQVWITQYSYTFIQKFSKKM